jgi:pyruvate dehydrogenase E1 component
VAYDPTYAYELAVIIQDGMRRMYAEQERVFYYITVMNENYVQPPMPEGARGHPAGLYRCGRAARASCVQLLGSGTILREVLKAAEVLEQDYQRRGRCVERASFRSCGARRSTCERWNMLHPDLLPRVPTCARPGEAGRDRSSRPPTTCASCPTRSASGCRARYVVLGTDGFGRSDSRAALRDFFEVDHRYVVIATLKALADEGSSTAARCAAPSRSSASIPKSRIPVTV